MWERNELMGGFNKSYKRVVEVREFLSIFGYSRLTEDQIYEK
jgi:hypothetical protein